MINTDDAKNKEKKKDDEESEEINYETPDTNIQDIIEEMKKRRRNVEENKKDTPTNSKANAYEEQNPLR